MENASKALLIAGGVLVSILVVTLFIYMINSITNFSRSNKELAEIKDIAQFNERFTNYQRDDVQGYELLSLIHNVIDYNEQYTTDSISNKEDYNPVTLTIDMDDNLREELTRDRQNRLFTRKRYSVTAEGRNSQDSFQRQIEDTIQSAKDELKVKGDDVGNKLAKNISNIFMTESEIEKKEKSKEFSNIEESKRRDSVLSYMANMYNQCTGLTGADAMLASEAKQLIIPETGTNNNKYYKYANILYEYMQFKRAVFKCSKLEYNDNNGRVSKMELAMVKIK